MTAAFWAFELNQGHCTPDNLWSFCYLLRGYRYTLKRGKKATPVTSRPVFNSALKHHRWPSIFSFLSCATLERSNQLPTALRTIKSKHRHRSLSISYFLSTRF